MRRSFLVLLQLSVVLSTACGPMVTVETGGEGDSVGSTTDEPPSTMVGTSPMTTVGPTTTPPDDTTIGPEDTGVFDTGVFDTGEVWLDLPEDCSTFEQDCPPGYKCTYWANNGGGSWNDTRCVPLDPDPGAPGEPCTVEGNGATGLDDCDLTSMCWDVDPETNEGVCVAFCIGDEANPECADRCSYCAISGDSTITICLDSCDPITQDCAPGEACYPVGSYFTCAPDASPPGTGVGSTCEFINVCPPGMFCLDASSVPGCDGGLGCCAPTCPVGGADPCPGLLPGTECTPWFEEGDEPPWLCTVAPPGVCVSMP